tara:strand:- start:1690 stop:3303 length:1614 start_codon:yes stop_codon:yes gene_type:complete
MKKALILIFLALIVTKLILSTFIQVPLGYSDSLAYMQSAGDFFNDQSLIDQAENKFPFLYPIIISPAYFFNDIHFGIILINAILSSAILFPAYLLSKEFLNKKKSLTIATITTLIPPVFIFTFIFMSESLFYTLFLLTIYFIYKAFKNNTLIWNILAGIGIALCFQTKILALFLFPTIVILAILNREKIYNKIILLVTALIATLPWIIARGTLYGYELFNIIGYPDSIEVSTGLHLTSKLTWFFLHIDYLIIATGIVFLILTLQAIIQYKQLTQNQKLLTQVTLVSTFFLFLITANHSGSYQHYYDYRIVGRYIACIFPLFILLGATTLHKFKKISKTATIGTAAYIALTTPFLLYDTFFPINNSSWTHIGILKYILPSTVLITILLVIATLVFLKNIKIQKLLTIAIIYFLLISLLNTAVIIYDTEYRWKPTEPVQLGLFLEDKTGRVLIDIDLTDFEYNKSENLANSNERQIEVMAYWLEDYIIKDLGDYQDYDYIVTKEYLPLPIVYVSEQATKVYYNPAVSGMTPLGGKGLYK